MLRHHAKAILREDSRGARLAKETKGLARGASTARWPRSWPLHRAAELAGARQPSIYIRAHYDPGERAPRGRSLGHASLGAWPAGRWVSPGSR